MLTDAAKCPPLKCRTKRTSSPADKLFLPQTMRGGWEEAGTCMVSLRLNTGGFDTFGIVVSNIAAVA